MEMGNSHKNFFPALYRLQSGAISATIAGVPARSLFRAGTIFCAKIDLTETSNQYLVFCYTFAVDIPYRWWYGSVDA